MPDVERFCAHHGHTITARYQLSESAWQGGKDNGEYRAALKQAMDDAWQGKFSVIVVWALDRLTREGAEGALRVIRQFRERGCAVKALQPQGAGLPGIPPQTRTRLGTATAVKENGRVGGRVRQPRRPGRG